MPGVRRGGRAHAGCGGCRLAVECGRRKNKTKLAALLLVVVVAVAVVENSIKLPFGFCGSPNQMSSGKAKAAPRQCQGAVERKGGEWDVKED